MSNLQAMPGERPRSPWLSIVGLAWAALIIILAFVLVIIYGPTLEHKSASERLAAALQERLPGSAPQVSGASTEALSIQLQVDFDPLIDADQTQTVFDRALATARGEDLEAVQTIEVRLTGRDLEGNPTSASRTWDYTPASHP